MFIEPRKSFFVAEGIDPIEYIIWCKNKRYSQFNGNRYDTYAPGQKQYVERYTKSLFDHIKTHGKDYNNNPVESRVRNEIYILHYILDKHFPDFVVNRLPEYRKLKLAHKTG